MLCCYWDIWHLLVTQMGNHITCRVTNAFVTGRWQVWYTTFPPSNLPSFVRDQALESTPLQLLHYIQCLRHYFAQSRVIFTPSSCHVRPLSGYAVSMTSPHTYCTYSCPRVAGFVGFRSLLFTVSASPFAVYSTPTTFGFRLPHSTKIPSTETKSTK
jgi:hypothetical protein